MMTDERFQHYRTGNVRMDAEHKVLFIMMDKLLKSISAHDVIDIKEHRSVLVALLTEHVDVDEQEMKRLSYPYRTEHARAHSDMLHRLTTMTDSVMYKMQFSIVNSMEELFSDHIDLHDMQFVAWQRAQSDKYMNELTETS